MNFAVSDVDEEMPPRARDSTAIIAEPGDQKEPSGRTRVGEWRRSGVNA